MNLHASTTKVITSYDLLSEYAVKSGKWILFVGTPNSCSLESTKTMMNILSASGLFNVIMLKSIKEVLDYDGIMAFDHSDIANTVHKLFINSKIPRHEQFAVSLFNPDGTVV